MTVNNKEHLLQAAVYGVGLCAEYGGSVFKPLVGGRLLCSCFVSVFVWSCFLVCFLMGVIFQFLLSAEALSRLDMVIRHPNAQHSDNVMAYDNAVSAFGKICQFHRDSIDATQVDDILLLQTLIFRTCLSFQNWDYNFILYLP